MSAKARNQHSGERVQARSIQTRRRIKDAVVLLLERSDYSQLSVANICDAADIAVGGFYFHFKNKEEAIAEVFDQHYSSLWESLRVSSKYGDLFSAVHHANLAFVRAVSSHPGVSRCFNQYAALDQDLVRLWEASAKQWAREFAASVADNPAVIAASEDEAFLQIYVLLGCTDSMLCQVYLERDPQFAALASAPERLAEELAILWCRGLTGSNPAPDRLAFQ